MADAPRYRSGETVLAGDKVDYVGARARIVVVIPTQTAVEGFNAADWQYLGEGFMMETEGHVLYHWPEADEDIVLLERA